MGVCRCVVDGKFDWCFVLRHEQLEYGVKWIELGPGGGDVVRLSCFWSAFDLGGFRAVAVKRAALVVFRVTQSRGSLAALGLLRVGWPRLPSPWRAGWPLGGREFFQK